MQVAFRFRIYFFMETLGGYTGTEQQKNILNRNISNFINVLPRFLSLITYYFIKLLDFLSKYTLIANITQAN